MKKLFILLSVMGIAIIGYAQTGCPNCVIASTFTTTDGLPGINISSLPPACLGQAYSQDVTLYLPGTFPYQGMTVNLRNIVINTITGMPPGLNWEKNGGGNTWTVNGTTTRGCFRICGTPTSTGAFSGTINVTVNVTVFGIPQAQTQSFNLPMNVTDVPVQAGPITGSPVVYFGQTGVNYSVPAIANATSYIWNYSGTGATINGTGSNVTIDFSSSATGGVLTSTATNSCGNGPVSADYPVSAVAPPAPDAAGAIAGTDSVCAGQTGVLYFVPLIANATSYIWEYSGTGVTINGNTDSVYLDFSANATSGDLTVEGHNTISDGVTSPLYSIFVRPLPDTAGVINGPVAICTGHNGDYLIQPINNALTYIWNYSGLGASITGPANLITIHFDSTATDGELMVFGQNTCGNSDTSILAIIIYPPLSAPLAISGIDTVCAGDTGNVFTIARVINADSYIWSYDGTGATITGSDSAVSINFASNATSGNLSVAAQNNCGSSVNSPLHYITVDDCNVGISEKVTGLKMNIIPNPGNGVFHLLITSNEVAMGSYQIINSVGQIIKSGGIELQQGTNIIRTDMSNIPEGIYYIRLNTGHDSMNNMIVISR